MHSSLYQGFVTHIRTSPIKHSFRYPVTMAFLDLSEVPALRKSLNLFTGNRWGPASFLEKDHTRTEVGSLDQDIRSWYHSKTGQEVLGPIRLLTLLRSWGYYFSPINMYYLFNAEATAIEGIVAEVSNTPWRETYRYLLKPEEGRGREAIDCEQPKEFHVSPFMDMTMHYQWHCTAPGDSLLVNIKSVQSHEHLFTAHLELSRRGFTDREIARALWRSPWSTARIVANIYWQALKLWWKRCPFYPHPNKRTTPADNLVR
ncbi:DUF1365 domain-containing protein [Bythopirellula polymerisocia]|uniref:DUF1365 domain-containing protein n=1 Tax=Bythopirellula polymerisocia TaxID=2528003 RepID=A0A5C6CSV7_9BACT|nr:DUF1365 domain-containing protein [Bythopirellula polymerisocia]TWU27478.1 hypothetical protein Pla144_22520 [Bythopirellula polymerisocia]